MQYNAVEIQRKLCLNKVHDDDVSL